MSMSYMPSFALAHDYNPWESMHPWTRRHNCHDFGVGVTYPEVQLLSEYPNRALPRKDLTCLKNNVNLTSGSAHVGKDGFQVTIDVPQFRPSEITVKTTDNVIVVEGKHNERADDHGLITRYFCRKYKLPKGYNSDDLHSTLSSDGFLTIRAPVPSIKLGRKERFLEIQHTGPAHFHLKQNASTEDEEKHINGVESKGVDETSNGVGIKGKAVHTVDVDAGHATATV